MTRRTSHGPSPLRPGRGPLRHLVLIGATPEGKKELIGFQTGMRESAQSWKELLVDLKARGLSIAPEVAVGDGALGFWKALDKTFPSTRHQRCWLHKTLNVLDKFPKSVQPNAHKDLREIWLAPDRATAETAIAAFAEKYAAVESLIKDRETLLTFFDFPADHWDHLRTTNPIESVFATVRHRTVRMKGALSHRSPHGFQARRTLGKDCKVITSCQTKVSKSRPS